MKFYDHILQGHEATEQNAYDAARGLDWQAIETKEQSLPNLRYIDTVNGVGIYYDFAGDYYVFTDEAEVEVAFFPTEKSKSEWVIMRQEEGVPPTIVGEETYKSKKAAEEAAQKIREDVKKMETGGGVQRAVDMYISKDGDSYEIRRRSNDSVSAKGNKEFIAAYIRKNGWSNMYSNLSNEKLVQMVDEKSKGGKDEPVAIKAEALLYSDGGKIEVGGKYKGGEVVKLSNTHMAVLNKDGQNIDIYERGIELEDYSAPEEFLKSIPVSHKEDLESIFDRYSEEVRSLVAEAEGETKSSLSEDYGEVGGFGGSGIIEVKPKHAHRDEVAELISYLDSKSYSYDDEISTSTQRAQNELPYIQVYVENTPKKDLKELHEYLESNSWAYVNLYENGGGVGEEMPVDFVKRLNASELPDDVQKEIKGLIGLLEKENMPSHNEHYKNFKSIIEEKYPNALVVKEADEEDDELTSEEVQQLINGLKVQVEYADNDEEKKELEQLIRGLSAML